MPYDDLKKLFEEFKTTPSQEIYDELKKNMESLEVDEIDQYYNIVSEINQTVFSDTMGNILDKISDFLNINSIEDYVRISNYEAFSSLVNDILRQNDEVPPWFKYRHLRAISPKKLSRLENKFVKIKAFNDDVQEKLMMILLNNSTIRGAVSIATTLGIKRETMKKIINKLTENDEFSKKIVYPDDEVNHISDVLSRYMEIYHFWKIAYASNTEIVAEKSSEEYFSEVQKLSMDVENFYAKIGRPSRQILLSAGPPYDKIVFFFDTKDEIIDIISREISKKKNVIEKLKSSCGDIENATKIIEKYRKSHLNDIDFDEVLSLYNDCI